MFLRLKSNHGTASFSYGQGGQLLSEVALNTANQALSRKNLIWLGAMPLAQVSEVLAADGSVASTEFVYLHADHLNTPRVATDSTGAVVWNWNSDAFGVASANEDVDGDGALVVVNLRFSGQYFDVESGLHYNYFRNYDPSTGRYIESDPIGLRGGVNTYAYVGGNPLIYSDPTGEIAILGLLANPGTATAVVNTLGLVGTAATAAWGGSEAINNSAADSAAEEDERFDRDEDWEDGSDYDQCSDGGENCPTLCKIYYEELMTLHRAIIVRLYINPEKAAGNMSLLMSEAHQFNAIRQSYLAECVMGDCPEPPPPLPSVL